MKIKSLSLFIGAFGIVLLGALVAVSLFLIRLHQKGIEADERLLASRNLAEELRQSSDDLTRMARTYVVTGDTIYKAYYFAILNIRNGKIPRPKNYSTTYWSLDKNLVPNGSLIPTDGERIPLKDLMRRAGILEQELQMLDTSQAQSDSLVNIELKAFAAIEGKHVDGGRGKGLHGKPRAELARSLLFNKEYQAAKDRIMEPINRFMAAVDGRTVTEQARLSRREAWWQLIALVIAVLLLASFVASCVYIRRSYKKITVGEAKLEAFIKYAGDSILIMDNKLRITDANDSACALLGYTSMELTGMQISEILPAQEQESYHSKLEILKNTGSSTHERRFRRKDGSEAETEVNVRLLEGAGYIAIIRDITERKRIKRELIEKKEQLTLFIEHSPASLAMFDTGMRYIATSRRWMNDYNLGNQNIIGKTHYEVFPEIGQEWKDIHQRCLKGAIERREEDSFTRADGTTDWLKWEIRPWHKSDGEIGGIIMFTEVITDRKKAEIQIEQSEEKHRALTENIGDAILLINEQARVIYQSPAVKRITGYHLSEDGDKPVFEFVHPEDVQISMACFKQAMATPGAPVPGQFRIQHKQGHFMWIEGTMVNLLHDESIKGFIVNFRDITERIKAAEAIKESEQNYRSLFEQASDVIIITDLEANIIEINASGCQMFGYTRQEMLGKNVSELVEPGQLKSDPLRIEEVIQGKHNVRRRLVRRKNGETFELESNTKRIFDDRSLIIARDITELRKAEKQIELSEEKHRALIENISDAIFLMNEKAEIIYRSPSGERISGYDVGELMGKSSFDFVHPDDLHLINDAFQRSTGLPGEPVQYQFRIRHKNGYYIWVEGSIINFIHNPSIKGFVVNYRDISDRKNAENQIHELNESLEQKVIDRTAQLQEANKALEAFSYSVSHDLKAPARAVTGFSKIIEKEYAPGFPPELNNLFAHISNSGKRMTAIIDDLLTLAKYEKVMPQQKTVDMDKLFRAVWDKIGIYGNGHRATLKMDPLPSASVDASLMEQVVVNLLSNAVKYSSKKENPTVTVGFERGDDTITYIVKDNGAGFDMKNYNKLFGAFQRLHGSSEFEGTGVGLLLVKRIIEKHGGVIRAEGVVNEGATFYFTLPAIHEG